MRAVRTKHLRPGMTVFPLAQPHIVSTVREVSPSPLPGHSLVTFTDGTSLRMPNDAQWIDCS